MSLTECTVPCPSSLSKREWRRIEQSYFSSGGLRGSARISQFLQETCSREVMPSTLKKIVADQNKEADEKEMEEEEERARQERHRQHAEAHFCEGEDSPSYKRVHSLTKSQRRSSRFGRTHFDEGEDEPSSTLKRRATLRGKNKEHQQEMPEGSGSSTPLQRQQSLANTSDRFDTQQNAQSPSAKVQARRSSLKGSTRLHHHNHNQQFSIFHTTSSNLKEVHSGLGGGKKLHTDRYDPAVDDGYLTLEQLARLCDFLFAQTKHVHSGSPVKERPRPEEASELRDVFDFLKKECETVLQDEANAASPASPSSPVGTTSSAPTGGSEPTPAAPQVATRPSFSSFPSTVLVPQPLEPTAAQLNAYLKEFGLSAVVHPKLVEARRLSRAPSIGGDASMASFQDGGSGDQNGEGSLSGKRTDISIEEQNAFWERLKELSNLRDVKCTSDSSKDLDIEVPTTMKQRNLSRVTGAESLSGATSWPSSKKLLRPTIQEPSYYGGPSIDADVDMSVDENKTMERLTPDALYDGDASSQKSSQGGFKNSTIFAALKLKQRAARLRGHSLGGTTAEDSNDDTDDDSTGLNRSKGSMVLGASCSSLRPSAAGGEGTSTSETTGGTGGEPGSHRRESDQDTAGQKKRRSLTVSDVEERMKVARQKRLAPLRRTVATQTSSPSFTYRWLGPKYHDATVGTNAGPQHVGDVGKVVIPPSLKLKATGGEVHFFGEKRREMENISHEIQRYSVETKKFNSFLRSERQKLLMGVKK